ncbi:YihY/virulence factor BrkB family protein [Cytophagaceae bacterium ABcell3]|nr:YihY/virulence factor BrkB family protein [Cytophagaceae bacterium ABcell3]
MKSYLKNIIRVVKLTFTEFFKANPLNYAAIIGFYTIFSLPGILLIIINIAGYAWGEEAVQGELANQIDETLGRQTAIQVQNVLENAVQSEATEFATFVGLATLLFSATTVFIAMQDSLNSLWHIRPKPSTGLVKLIKDRVLSFAMVISLGFLLLVSLTVNVAVVALQNFIRDLLEEFTVYLVNTINIIISLGVTALIFGLIYKVLPDAKVRWKDIWVGALITTFLFVLGKFLIGLYLSESELDTTYGAAGALVLLLVWVYYSSTIMLLGAQFTWAYATELGNGVKPTKEAMEVEIKEVSKENKP